MLAGLSVVCAAWGSVAPCEDNSEMSSALHDRHSCGTHPTRCSTRCPSQAEGQSLQHTSPLPAEERKPVWRLTSATQGCGGPCAAGKRAPMHGAPDGHRLTPCLSQGVRQDAGPQPIHRLVHMILRPIAPRERHSAPIPLAERASGCRTPTAPLPRSCSWAPPAWARRSSPRRSRSTSSTPRRRSSAST